MVTDQDNYIQIGKRDCGNILVLDRYVLENGRAHVSQHTDVDQAAKCIVDSIVPYVTTKNDKDDLHIKAMQTPEIFPLNPTDASTLKTIVNDGISGVSISVRPNITYHF